MADRISYAQISAAKAGDSIAITHILKHYEAYIVSHSKRTYFDEYGNRCELVDPDLKQRIESKLMLQIIYKFDMTKIPKNEIIQD